jgi:hypothetical protein
MRLYKVSLLTYFIEDRQLTHVAWVYLKRRLGVDLEYQLGECSCGCEVPRLGFDIGLVG